MDNNMIYYLFICIFIPLLVSVPLIQKPSRDILIYLIAGIFIALFVSELNQMLLKAFDDDIILVTTTVTPITEEIVKALPVVLYAFLFRESRQMFVSVSFALGVGFALFENTYILIRNVENLTLGWSVIRGFSTALMHGICTAAIGYGLSFVRTRKKLSIPGTVALLVTAIIYHGMFNMMVQSDNLQYVAYFLPGLTYIPFLVYLVMMRYRKGRKAAAWGTRQ